MKTPALGDTRPLDKAQLSTGRLCAAHRFGPSTIPPHLPCFLFTPALFCFANGFFIYFSCCCKLQGEKTRGTHDNPEAAVDRTGRDLAPLLLGAGTCWHMLPALPVPAASWPVWSLALRALVRIHHCQTLFRTLQKQTHITLSSSDRFRGHGKTKEPHCFDVPFAAWVPSADSFQSAWLSSI